MPKYISVSKKKKKQTANIRKEFCRASDLPYSTTESGFFP